MFDLSPVSTSTQAPGSKRNLGWVLAVVGVLLIAAVVVSGLFYVNRKAAQDRDEQRIANVLELYRSLQATAPFSLVFSGCVAGDPLLYCHVCQTKECLPGQDYTSQYLVSSLFATDQSKSLAPCKQNTAAPCLWTVEPDGQAAISPTYFRLRFSLEHGTEGTLGAGSHVMSGYGIIQ